MPPPFGLVQLVKDHPVLGEVSPGRLPLRAGRVVMTMARLAALQQVNALVNRNIKARRDPGGDVWSLWPEYGDCEDFAVTKQMALRNAGWPSAALILARVLTPWQERHCVLMVKGTSATLVLDNLSPEVRLFSKTGYTMIDRQGSTPLDWVSA